MIWTNKGCGIYSVPPVAKVDKQQIKKDMSEFEQRLKFAEAAMAARKGKTACVIPDVSMKRDCLLIG